MAHNLITKAEALRKYSISSSEFDELVASGQLKATPALGHEPVYRETTFAQLARSKTKDVRLARKLAVLSLCVSVAAFAATAIVNYINIRRTSRAISEEASEAVARVRRNVLSSLKQRLRTDILPTEDEMAELRAEIESVARKLPAETDLLCLMAELNIEEGKVEAAKDAIEGLQMEDDSSFLLALVKGRIAMCEERYKDAVQLLCDAPKTDVGDISAIYLVDAYRRLGNHSEVESICRDRLMESPANALLVDHLARHLIQRGRLDEAIRICESFLSNVREDSLVRADLAIAYFDIGDPQRSLGHILRVEDRTRRVRTQHALASAYAALGRTNEAVDELRVLLLRWPQNFDAALLLATIYWASDRSLDARAVLAKVDAVEKGRLEYRIIDALVEDSVLGTQGSTDGIMALWQEVGGVERTRENGGMLTLLAWKLASIRWFSEGAKAGADGRATLAKELAMLLKRELANAPYVEQALWLRVELSGKSGDSTLIAEAVDLVTKQLLLRPDSVEICFAAVLLACEQISQNGPDSLGAFLPTASDAAQRAVALKAKSGEEMIAAQHYYVAVVLDNRGEAVEKEHKIDLGYYERAAVHYVRAIEKCTDEATLDVNHYRTNADIRFTARANLGDLYRRMDRKQQAIEMLRESLDFITPEYEGARSGIEGLVGELEGD